MIDTLPPILAQDTPVGTGVYFRHAGDFAGTVQAMESTLAHVLPPGIPPGEGYPPIKYSLDVLTTRPIAADAEGTPAQRALYDRIEEQTGVRLRRDLETLHPYMRPKTAPAPQEGLPQATKRLNRMQAGTVTVGGLTICYSYATVIGILIGDTLAGSGRLATDCYYSTRTEEHAAMLGLRIPDTVYLPDPDFRETVIDACRAAGLARVPRADFSNPDRPHSAYPDSAYFGGKQGRGSDPRPGNYVYVTRAIEHRPDCDTPHGYRVRMRYCGLVRADDPARGWRKGQRMIRPAHMGYGEPTEAADSDRCLTEGGIPAFLR